MITIQLETRGQAQTETALDLLANHSRPQLRHPYMNRSLITLVFIALVTVVLAACAGSGANVLRDTEWELVSLAGSDVLPGTKITAKFSDDQISGSAGCNQYGGSYKATRDSLSTSDVFATMMGCLNPEGILEQETAYLTALGAAATYRIDGDKLELRDATGTQVLVFVSSSAGLE